jgi:ABC-type nitrate/sulfonate/bicarbonate transport system substrate-binding protein
MKRLSLLVSSVLVAALAVAALAAGCGSPEPEGLTPVTLMLDWVPNTNHTGIYVAKDKGYFQEAGLDVKIVTPGEVYPEAAVTGGAADFGISFQENVTLARAEGAPVVSVAAVMQHNTSGFASLAGLGVKSPADFEGLRYGAYGSASEAPTLKALMERSGADFSKLQIVTTGFSDPLALMKEGQIDLAWIFYGWQGLQAKQMGIDLDVVMMKDYLDVVPDYYTPVVIASEATIAGRPEVIKALLGALSRGYTFSADHPDEAAEILLGAVPELDRTLVLESQRWVSDYYIAEASRWGEQKESVWRDYSAWMFETGVLSTPVDAQGAFTNQFLP